MNLDAPKPEAAYRRATDLKDRQRIQAQVLAEYRTAVQALVWKLVRKHMSVKAMVEAEQVGCIGLLVALEKFDPARTGPDRGAAFWWFAKPHVQNEIQKWMDHGVYWRPRNRRADALPQPPTMHVSLEDLEQQVADDADSSEALVIELEGQRRLRRFAEELSPEERELLLTDNTRRTRSRRYLSLVARATESVKGDER